MSEGVCINHTDIKSLSYACIDSSPHQTFDSALALDSIQPITLNSIWLNFDSIWLTFDTIGLTFDNI